MKKGKYGHLLEDKNVKRWYENRARGSPITADVSLRRLGAFCKKNDLTPEDLANMEEKKIFNLLLDYVSSEEKKGYAGSYIYDTIKHVKSWLSFNDIEIRRRIKVKGKDSTPSLKDKKVPNQQELKKIFLSGDKKTRAAAVLIAHSGVREEVLGDYHGKDGLRVGDLPEMEIQHNKVVFNQIPTIIVIRPELSKKSHQYLTFLSEEGCGYLKDYLEERMIEGEKLSSDSPIITPKLRMKPFIRTVNIGDMLRNAIRKAGFNCRPYELRTFFDMQLMMAESKGHLIRDYRVFWMGHKGDIENHYTTNRSLPSHVIEQMRESYRKSQEFLQTEKSSSKEDLVKEFKKTILKVVGFKEEELDDVNPSDMTDEELQELVKKKLQDVTLSQNRQKVVSVENVASHIEHGWEFVAELSNQKAVVRLPN